MTNMRFSNGLLPVSQDSLDQLARDRARRIKQDTVPEGTSAKDYEKRVAILAELEMEGWQERENELAQEQDRHLQAIRKMLDARALKREVKRNAQVNAKRAKLERDKQRQMAKINKTRVQNLRKYATRRRALQGSGRDIILDHASATSRVHAPVARLGRATGKFQQMITLPGAELTDTAAIDAVERMVPPDMRQTKASTAEVVLLKHLGAVDPTLGTRAAASRARGSTIAPTSDEVTPPTEPGPTSVAPVGAKRAPVAIRPSTPEVPVQDRNTVEHDARVLVQRILRGRAGQNAMFLGKERRIALIKELRLTEIVEDDTVAQEAIRQFTAERDATAVIRHLEGATVAGLLDYYHKEHARTRQEAALRHVLQLATRVRHRREAEEMGRRQDAAERREKGEARFAAVSNAAKGGAHSLVAETVRASVADVSAAQAGEAALAQARAIATRDGAVHERYANNPRAIVRDQLASVLLANVDREDVERKIRLDQGRMRHALQKEMGHALDKVDAMV